MSLSHPRTERTVHCSRDYNKKKKNPELDDKYAIYFLEINMQKNALTYQVIMS